MEGLDGRSGTSEFEASTVRKTAIGSAAKRADSRAVRHRFDGTARAQAHDIRTPRSTANGGTRPKRQSHPL
jgi:hypothetical protein